MPFSQDILQNIVNIHWTGDLTLTWLFQLNQASLPLPGDWGEACTPIDIGGAWSQPKYFSGSSNISLVSGPVAGGDLDIALLESADTPSVTSGSVETPSGAVTIGWSPPVSFPGPLQKYMTLAENIVGSVCIGSPGPIGQTFPQTTGADLEYVVNQPSLIISGAGLGMRYSGGHYDVVTVGSFLTFHGTPDDAPYRLGVTFSYR